MRMTTTTNGDVQPFARLAAAGQTASMSMLLAEMQALSVMFRGLGAVAPFAAPEPQDEAETEQAFDNMPV